MSDVTLSSAVRSNLLSLQTTADLMSKTQERLATGLKVNSALDNPTNFFTASALNSRASDLGRLMDGVSNATQTLEAADNGISAITKLVESAQATLRQAQQASPTIEVPGVFGSRIVNDTNASVTGTQAIAQDTIGLTGTTVTGLDADDTAATVTSTLSGLSGSANATSLYDAGDVLEITIGAELYAIEFVDDETSPTVAPGSLRIELGNSGTGSFTIDTVLGNIQSAVQNDPGINGDAATIGLNGSGQIVVSAGTVGAGDLEVFETGNVDKFTGVTPSTASATNSTLAGLSGTLTLTNTAGTQSIDMSAIDNAADFAGALGLGSLTGVDTAVGANGVSFNNAAESFTIGGTDAAALGFGSGNTQATAVNADLDALSGQTLIIGDDTLTFGSNDGAGEINTRAEFETALANLTTPNLEASIDGTTNQLTVSATGGLDQTIEIGGTANTWTEFGIPAWTYPATSSTLTSYSAPLDSENQSFFFNQGEGLGNTQVSVIGVDSVQMLSDLISLLPGASYDPEDQRIEIYPEPGVDTITITNNGARKFGLEPGVYNVGTQPNPERADFVDQYNEIMAQIDELAEDSGFNGVNLLNGDDLSVIFNEDGSSGLSIAGTDFDAAGLGLAALASTGLDADADINTSLGALDSAISALRSQASEFGSNLSIVETREDFTKAMINTLETGSANLTLADTNQEGANLLALQTRQQLSSTALSLASQADQNVLRLF